MTTPRERRIVGVSTKMYFSFSRTTQYINRLLHLLDASSSVSTPPSNIDIFVIPDHITLTTVAAELLPTHLWPGAQDVFHEDAGAFTGEVSPAVLAEVGCRIVEVGHAERRRLFAETDEITAKKAAAVARNRMVPLVCIGEQVRGDTPASAAEECRAQIEPVLAAVPDAADVVLAYEPVWAIGAAEPAEVGYVVAVTLAIRGLECVRGRAGRTRILYGGSAGPGLFEKLKEGVDGLFLGRFAHDPEQFVKTIREVAEA